MIRKILAFLLGGIAGGVFNMALVTVSHAVYPLPEGLDPNDFEELRAHVEANGMPTGAMIIVLVAVTFTVAVSVPQLPSEIS